MQVAARDDLQRRAEELWLLSAVPFTCSMSQPEPAPLEPRGAMRMAVLSDSSCSSNLGNCSLHGSCSAGDACGLAASPASPPADAAACDGCGCSCSGAAGLPTTAVTAAVAASSASVVGGGERAQLGGAESAGVRVEPPERCQHFARDVQHVGGRRQPLHGALELAALHQRGCRRVLARAFRL